VVSAVSGANVTVDISGRLVSLPILSPWVPAVGDVALVLQTLDGRSYAIGKLGHVTGPFPPVPPPSPTATGYSTFPAVQAGTYVAGVWRPDIAQVMHGDAGLGLCRGVWWYGDAIQYTLAGLRPLSATIFIERRPDAGNPASQAINAILHRSVSQTATPPATILSDPLGSLTVDQSYWWPLPATWVTKLCDGTARGIGVYQAASTPFSAYSSLAENDQSGAIRIDWTV